MFKEFFLKKKCEERIFCGYFRLFVFVVKAANILNIEGKKSLSTLSHVLERKLTYVEKYAFG